jgi:hypothetical protein
VAFRQQYAESKGLLGLVLSNSNLDKSKMKWTILLIAIGLEVALCYLKFRMAGKN